MNKFRKARVAALAGLGALALTSAAVFADNSDSTTTATTNSGALHQKGMRNGEAKMGSSFVNPFYRTDLTDAEKAAAVKIEETYRTALKTYYESNASSLKEAREAAKTASGTTTPAVDAALKTIQDTYLKDITSYIATDKLAQFTEMLGKGPMMMGSQMGAGRGEGMGPNGGNRGDFGGNKYAKTIDAKLATLSTKEAKVSWLNAVNVKIDALKAKVTSKKSTRLLEGLQDAINSELDELNGTDLTDETIDGLLK